MSAGQGADMALSVTVPLALLGRADEAADLTPAPTDMPESSDDVGA